MKRRILMYALCTVLVFGLSGCGKENKWIFSLNGEKLYDTEIRAFGVIYSSEHNIADSEQLGEIYEGKQTYEDYYKEEFLDFVIENTVLYAEAKKEGLKLSKEAAQEVQDKTGALVTSYSEEWLEIKNLTREDIEEAYEKKAMGECYLKEQITAGEQGDDSQDAEAGEQMEKERYIRVFQVTFPTVELDDEGIIVTDADGKGKRLSGEELKKKKQEAEEFAQSAQNGENIEQLLKKYDKTVTGIEYTLKYEDLSPTYKKAVDGLKINGISDVIESDYGYYVVKLLDTDDNQHTERIATYEKNAAMEEKKSDIVKKLLDTYTKDEAEYWNKEAWENISFSSFLR
ncbi:MAG: peptidyl-prolyl cis-trans isomerase [Lachnospiraceae bacterium]|nr:peptidyl-prolyl cis-trans isomerase [Lachnospiraceae bacterium]